MSISALGKDQCLRMCDNSDNTKAEAQISLKEKFLSESLDLRLISTSKIS